jgi:hypothetical protein
VRDGWTALGLGQQDRVGAAGDDTVEIRVGEAGVERVHPHHQRLLARTAMLPEIGEGGLARPRLAVGCDRVLEVEDQRVGLAVGAFGELLVAVGRNEEEGAHWGDSNWKTRTSS